MKKRLVSTVLVLCILLQFFSVPVSAATTDHTYYSQYGNVSSSVDPYLCYLTCLAMAISDLGNPTTPSDVYRANGNTAYTYWDIVQKAYGIIVKETPLASFNVETGKSKVANLLNSGSYPQGIMLVFKYQYWNKNTDQYEDAFHAVLARKVVNGVIYCDDPAKTTSGCCIPLEQCYKYTSSGTYAGIYSYRTITKSSSWPGNGLPSSGETIVSPVSAISIVSGKWIVTIPANYKLVCYDSANATKSSTYYIAAKTTPYTLTCSQQATLSNGIVRYFFVSGDGKNLWFDYTSGMSVPNNDVSYTVTFDANGGSVVQSSKVVISGQKYGDMPMTSRNGYTFDGWFTSANGGVQVTAASTVSLTSNRTLYAHWAKETTPTYEPAENLVIPLNYTVLESENGVEDFLNPIYITNSGKCSKNSNSVSTVLYGSLCVNCLPHVDGRPYIVRGVCGVDERRLREHFSQMCPLQYVDSIDKTMENMNYTTYDELFENMSAFKYHGGGWGSTELIDGNSWLLAVACYDSSGKRIGHTIFQIDRESVQQVKKICMVTVDTVTGEVISGQK